ncbi:MAG: hypothetical protein ABGY75_22365 [Gemmataceae bacterium]
MTTPPAAPTAKETALQALQRMPETATLDEISEELAILAAIQRGEAAADAGRLVPQDEVARRSAAWTSR